MNLCSTASETTIPPVVIAVHSTQLSFLPPSPTRAIGMKRRAFFTTVKPDPNPVAVTVLPERSTAAVFPTAIVNNKRESRNEKANDNNRFHTSLLLKTCKRLCGDNFAHLGARTKRSIRKSTPLDGWRIFAGREDFLRSHCAPATSCIPLQGAASALGVAGMPDRIGDNSQNE